MKRCLVETLNHSCAWIGLFVLLFLGKPVLGQPGTVYSSSAIWGAGAYISFQIDNATGIEGVNWSKNVIAGTPGTLTITATPTNPFVVSIESLQSGTGDYDALVNWDADVDHSWRFISTTGGISGFSANKFQIDDSLFTAFNATNEGKFLLRQTGNDLYVDFIAGVNLPEPGYAGLLPPLLCVLVGCRGRGSVRGTCRSPDTKG